MTPENMIVPPLNVKKVFAKFGENAKIASSVS
jgi:hypothetical protein